MYGSDQKFIGEVNKICSKIVEEILNHLKYLGSTDQLDKQSTLALELFNCFVIRADLRDPALANMAINLWHLSQRHGSVDPKVTVNIIFTIKRNIRHLYVIVLLVCKLSNYFLNFLDENKGLHDAEKSSSGI